MPESYNHRFARGRPTPWREQKHLYYVAVRHCGSWQTALAEIGLRSRSVGRKWTPERVLTELRRHLRAGDTSISISNPPLASAARIRFGSLSAAWRALGVEPPRRGSWTAKRVIEAIQNRYVRGLPIARACDGGPSLRNAALRYFDGWRSALEAAGLSEHYVPPVAARSYSRTEVLDEIRGLPHEEGRLTLPSTRVPALCNAARKHFGTWCRAVRQAGRKTLRRSWTRANVIAEIRALHDGGASLNSAHQTNLVAAARRFFTGWHAALDAAGIPKGERHVA